MNRPRKLIGEPMVYIVLVNWNGWQDTLECLESIFHLEWQRFVVVICDNASSDGSIDKIAQWCDGDLVAPKPDARPEAKRSASVGKPIVYRRWLPGEKADGLEDARVILVAAEQNLGFAAGCNIGMRFAMQRGDADFVWLLNNDTVVDSKCLTKLVEKMTRQPSIGISGALLRYYAQPELVQCYGGYGFNEWTARVLPLRIPDRKGQAPSESEVESQLKYVSGASSFVRAEFVQRIGLMNEQYFLYFEEIDWAIRARGFYSLGFCGESEVFHKEGRAIGSSPSRLQRSLNSEAYLSRNRILFTRTYYPSRLIVVLLWVTGVSLMRMLLGNKSHGWTMLTSSWKAITIKPQRPPSGT